MLVLCVAIVYDTWYTCIYMWYKEIYPLDIDRIELYNISLYFYDFQIVLLSSLRNKDVWTNGDGFPNV